jgi:hypothetical protein
MCPTVFFITVANSLLGQVWNWAAQINNFCQRQQSCNWWCLCCNKWFCLILTVIVVLVLYIIGLIVYIACVILCTILWTAGGVFFGNNLGDCFALNLPPAGTTSPSGSAANSTATFTIGGTVTGLAGQTIALLLTNSASGARTQTWTGGEGPFAFGNPVSNGFAYTVSAVEQPDLTITIINAGGTVNGANVTNVQVNCQLSKSGI